MTPIHLIAGPTASGKSTLALRLAQEIDAEIVNADALQVYADLRVLSARPPPEEEALVPHHLFGVADAADGWSVGRWLRETARALDAIGGRGRPAIVVGGTGLYFSALTKGLAEIPTVPDSAVAAAQQIFDAEGEAAFRKALSNLDPAAEARISPGDRQRLVRALAVASATGRSLTDWRADTQPLLAPGAWTGVVLEPPRDTLYARCDARLSAMVDHGAVEEAARLATRKLSPALPAMKAVGLREFAACPLGELSLDDALAAARLSTRHFAKRQMTWFRNQTPDWPRITAAEAEAQWRELQELWPKGPLAAAAHQGSESGLTADSPE